MDKRDYIRALPANLSSTEKERRWKQHASSASAAKALSRAADLMDGGFNSYLQALVDPEGVDDVGVPDEVYAPTARFQSVLQSDMLFTAAGNFAIAVRPDFNSNVLMSGTATAREWDLGSLIFGAPNANVNFGYINPEHQHDQSIHLVPSYMACTGGLLVSGTNRRIAIARPLSPIDNVDGQFRVDGVFLQPLVGAGTLVINFEVTSELLDAQIANIVAGCVLTSTSATGTVVIVAATSSGIFDSDGTHFTKGYINYASCPQGWLSYTVSTTGSACFLNTINLSYSETAAPTSAFPIRYQSSIDSPLAVTLRRDMTAYRPVSMSVLVTYYGNMLENDLVAARLVSTGHNPNDLSSTVATDQGDLAEMPDSYSGPLQQGCYAVWAPRSLVQASAWHDVTSPQHLWFDESYIAIAGHASTDAQKIRVRVVLNIEALTNSRLYHPTPFISPYPDEMGEALKLFSLFKPVGENNIHLQRIGAFLKKNAPKAGKGLLKFALQNRGAIAALGATAVGAPEFAKTASQIANSIPVKY